MGCGCGSGRGCLIWGLGSRVCVTPACDMLRIGVHAAKVLGEEVFAVEVVGSIGRVVALVAAPEAHAEVLGHGVAFPFVLGVEG